MSAHAHPGPRLGRPWSGRSLNMITPLAMVTSPNRSKWPETALLKKTKSNTAEVQACEVRISDVDKPRSTTQKITTTATGEAEEGRVGIARLHAKIRRRVTPSKAENAKYP